MPIQDTGTPTLMYGLATAMPDPRFVPDGTKYYQTDTTNEYQSQGSQWVLVGLPASAVTGSLPSAPMSSSAAGQIINVPNFQANTLYPAGFAIQQAGIAYTRNTLGTSGASFAADASNWTALGGSSELGYTQFTSNTPASPFVNTTALTAIGLSTTVTVGSRPIEIEFWANAQNVTTNAINGNVAIFEDGTQVANVQIILPASDQFGGVPVTVKARRNPAAGSHTYDIRASTGNAANTYTFIGAANAPGFVRVNQA